MSLLLCELTRFSEVFILHNIMMLYYFLTLHILFLEGLQKFFEMFSWLKPKKKSSHLMSKTLQKVLDSLGLDPAAHDSNLKIPLSDFREVFQLVFITKTRRGSITSLTWFQWQDMNPNL